MDIINEALEAAVNGKDKSDWTPVSVNVAPATLTILSKQVRQDAALRESVHPRNLLPYFHYVNINSYSNTS